MQASILMGEKGEQILLCSCIHVLFKYHLFCVQICSPVCKFLYFISQNKNGIKIILIFVKSDDLSYFITAHMVQTFDLRISNIAKKRFLALILVANSVLKQELQSALEKQTLCISGALHNWVFNPIELPFLCPILKLYFCNSFGNLILMALPCSNKNGQQKSMQYFSRVQFTS